jgi:hypothetical protein
MTLLPRHLLLVATIAALGFVGAILLAQPGCSNSNCNKACLPTYVYIGSADAMTQIPVTGIYLDGAACPAPYGVTCIGTQTTGGCTHFTITAIAQGTCDVGITFSDRDSEIIHLEFGPIESCCPGYPVNGDSTFTVPADPTQPITGNVSGAGRTTIVPDGGVDAGDGATGDGAAGDGAASDGATD